MLAVLSGCGGGSGSGASAGNVVVPSSPAPTPAPTPTPAAAGTTLLNFKGPQQFSSLSAILQYGRPTTGGAVTIPNNALNFSPTATVSFIEDGPSATKYYLFSASTVNSPAQYSVAFTTSSIDANTSDKSFATYQTQTGTARYALTMLVPGPTNTKLALNYVGIGTVEATQSDIASGAVATDFRPFGYGFLAEESAVPATGTGHYVGILVGRAISIGGAAVYKLTGSMTLTTNFTTQTFTGSITITATNDRSGEVVELGTLPITSNVPYAKPLNSIGAYIGSGRDELRAALAGPAAEELEGAFTLILADPRTPGGSLKLVGAVAARR